MGLVTELSDEFVYADGNLTAATPNWVAGYTGSDIPQVSSNALRSLNAGTGVEAVWYHPIGWNVWAELTIKTITQGTGNNLALILTMRKPAPASQGGYQVLAKANGFGTTTDATNKLHSSFGGNSTETWANSDVLRAELVDMTVKVYRNGTLVLTATDTIHDADAYGYYLGFGVFHSGGTTDKVELESFRGGPIIPRGDLDFEGFH